MTALTKTKIILLCFSLFCFQAVNSGLSAYPVIHPDNTVTFTYSAPYASNVTLTGDFVPWGTQEILTNDGSGTWSVTVGPLGPDIYRYVFQVDGSPALDQSNLDIVPTYWGDTQNSFEVPGEATGFLKIEKTISYGDLRTVWYYSSVLDRMRRMRIYTPHQYDRGKKRYPVLYLLGGAGESDQQWGPLGRAGIILENLISQNKAEPMVIVMPNGHIDEPGKVTPPDADFGDELLVDIIPYVEKHYHVSTKREQRGLTGLSMGASQTVIIGLQNIDTFAYLGAFSGAIFGDTTEFEVENQSILTDPSVNSRLNEFWFGCGTEDFVYAWVQNTMAMLDKYGIDYTYVETGGGHTWTNWRDYWFQFSQLLFKDKRHRHKTKNH